MSSQAGFVSRTFPQRLGIFVDVQNMFYSAKLLHQSKVDYARLLRELTGTRHLIRAIAYIVHKPEVNQSGFHEALMRLGYELKIKELKIRPEVDGRAGATQVKGSWDIGLTIDAIQMAPKLDTVVLVTGDGDFVPLVDALKAHGCRVEVVSFERSTASELIRAADQYVSIQDAWIFKERKFEGALPPGAVVGTSNHRGSTARGETVYEGLPDDDELDAESRAVEQAERFDEPDDLDESLDDEPLSSGSGGSSSKRERHPDFGILA